VNPTNVMGTSKLMGERLMSAASLNNRNSRTIFASTRFGNVLGSRGSVVPLFRRQIEKGGPITLTDRRMTRFIMTLEEAVSMVLKSVWIAQGGEVFVTKMPTVRIEDIAIAMGELTSDGKVIEIREIGAKPGEKMYEELFNDEEVRRTFEIDDFFVVLPACASADHTRFPLIVGRKTADRAYNSSVEPPMSSTEVREYLVNRSIL